MRNFPRGHHYMYTKRICHPYNTIKHFSIAPGIMFELIALGILSFLHNCLMAMCLTY